MKTSVSPTPGFRPTAVLAAAVVLSLTVSFASRVGGPPPAAMESAMALQEAAPGLFVAADPVAKRLSPAAPGAAMTRDDLQQHFDPLFARLMHEWHIPGAVFAVVRHGKVLYTRGYGCADREQQRPVDPDRTLFRVASVSKTFMATAALQLVEQGKLDLDTDINRYLNHWKLETPQPITMANLLTHSAGFDEKFIGMAARTEAEHPPLGDYLRENLPPQVLEPGTVSSYSNHGSALAGYVIEQVSGEPFPEYVDRHILQPLQMHHSSFVLPPTLRPDIAVGYEPLDDGRVVPVPFDYLNVGPAGGLNATAGDMTHYMIAHLHDGEYQGARILKPETAEEMHTIQFRHHPALPGYCWGFYSRYQNGLRSIEHNGLWRGFGTSMFLLPSEDTGIFVSCNLTETRLGEVMVWEFLNRYFPGVKRCGGMGVWACGREHAPAELCGGVGAPGALYGGTGVWACGGEGAQGAEGSGGGGVDGELSHVPARELVGDYRFNRYDRRTFCKFLALFQEFHVVPAKAGGDHPLDLVLPTGLTLPMHPEESDPLLFRLGGTQQKAAFRVDVQGRVTYLLVGTGACERLEWWESAPFQLTMIRLLSVLYINLAGAGAVLWGARRLKKRARVPADAAMDLAAISGLLLAVFWTVMPWGLFGSGMELVYGVPARGYVVLLLPLLGWPAGIRAWRVLLDHRKEIRLGWVGVVLYLPVLLATGWVLLYWNMLGF